MGNQGFLPQRAGLNVELAVCLNDAQATEAIKQAKVHGATTALPSNRLTGKCVSAGVQGEGGGGVGLPSFCGVL